MFEFENVRIIAAKELRDSLRNRWFLIFTVAFAGLALALSAIGQSSGTQLRFSGYGRTAASLINLVLLFVPLISLTLGATNLAGDRENGTLAYLLAQPVNHTEVILGKYLGMAGSLFSTITLGFGLAGVALALQGSSGDVVGYVATIVLAYLLALAMLSLGFFMAAFVKKTAGALGGSLFMWLLLVFIGDLGIMGTAVVTQMPIEAVFFIAMLNPLHLFKVSSILTIQASLEVLGPVGVYATEQFGTALLPLAAIGLLLWIVIPLIGALLLFTRQEKFVWS
ncbi:MAG: ABC transporter permease [Chloroflexi bacterium]|nr:MAG: ABC transporter permease [Chloroflexota bacterium]